LKILYYIHFFYVGGAEKLSVDYLLDLKKRGHDVSVVVNVRMDTFLERRLIDNGVKIYTLFSEENNLLRKAKGFLKRRFSSYKREWERIYREVAPDAVHIHTYLDQFELCDFPAERVVYSFHTDIDRFLSLGTEKNRKKMLELAKQGAVFTSLNQDMLESVKEKLATDRAVYLPNGVDISAIRAQKRDKRELLLELSLPEDSFVVGHVGRFHPIKNHEKLFEVFSEIAKREPKARLLVVGDGAPEDEARIAALIEKYGVFDKTLCLGVRDDASAIMSIFDVLIFPSILEGFSLVLVEAQALGIRAIASDSVPKEVVCENCLALPLSESAQKWAEEAFKDHESLGSVEQFDMPRIIERLEEIYKGAL
jgi:glycosyltransferase involved in cell wall biosynthesis